MVVHLAPRGKTHIKQLCIRVLDRSPSTAYDPEDLVVALQALVASSGRHARRRLKVRWVFFMSSGPSWSARTPALRVQGDARSGSLRVSTRPNTRPGPDHPPTDEERQESGLRGLFLRGSMVNWPSSFPSGVCIETARICTSHRAPA